MGVTKVKQSTVDQDHLVHLYDVMLEHGDKENAQKILDLYEKFKKKQFIVSFAGHFSAGKSSMINAILGTDILPKSPIPTSANIVNITSGDGVARVFFHHEDPLEYKEPYDFDMIKSYCQDKDTIARIELSTSEEIIPRNCSIFDTPGIDAADDADRLMTESSLHLVDKMFYVMDYNHVQSEVNLHFLQKMQMMHIPYYVIINQIDKHDENEVSFSQFEQNIKQTFNQWNVTPKGIYFSSLVDPSVEHNQFPMIKDKLFSLFNMSRLDDKMRMDEAVQQVIQDHRQYLQQAADEQMSEWSTKDSFTEEDQKRLTTFLEHIDAAKERPKEVKQTFDYELNQTLKNAYLMPAKLRDQAALFLESQQKDFKVGFFGTKRKTAQVKKERLHDFFHGLKQSFETNIQWRLRDKLHEVLKQHTISSQEITDDIQNLSIEYTEEDLLQQLKPGAQLNGNYVLNYTDDLSVHIKQKFRQAAQAIWEKVDLHVTNEMNEQLHKLEQEKNRLEQILYDQEQQDTIQSTLENREAKLTDILTNPPQASDDQIKVLDQKLEVTFQEGHEMEDLSELNVEETIEHAEETTRPAIQTKYSVNRVIPMIDETIETVKALPGFQSMIDDLTEKGKRLHERTYTIALFGAFSAGKSSFSNALIGSEVLPTSPNPTTAVINRILPPSDSHKHGTVVIHMKDERTLVDDLLEITKDFSPQAEDVPSLVQWIQAEKIHENDALNRTLQSFLRAVIDGYDHNVSHIGEKLIIDMDRFETYITDETKACYIEAMDLYYDCSLTRQGITLVDTPGANSVNARHTNVAFDYIKYADAIIYVTYYNHALSRADRDFVMQLGRVKEAFELDKMFFIINASDLAENESELKLVKNYVEEQLLQLGIRFPRIYPLSSKESLNDKLNEQPLNKQMAAFERSFHSFIDDDLDALMVESALFDINRTRQSLESLIETVNLNEQEKDEYEQHLLHEQRQVEQVIQEIDIQLIEDRLRHRIDRQLHYVKERFSIRFHDLFKDTFNPTTITESGRKAKPQLQRALRSLLDYSGQELLQEVRAVSLRIENYMRELMKELDDDVRKHIGKLETNFIVPGLMELNIETPEYVPAFRTMDVAPFEHALGKFKGTKAFFVNNEREVMKEDIYDTLNPFIEEYIMNMSERMHEAYVRQNEGIVRDRQTQLLDEVSRYVDHHITMMSRQVDIKQLHEKHMKLTEIVSG
ncbi:MAG TPA: dynamin family protein [Bacillota bacterium]|nr:dynamin family protein [Bacillota bacterium]